MLSFVTPEGLNVNSPGQSDEGVAPRVGEMPGDHRPCANIHQDHHTGIGRKVQILKGETEQWTISGIYIY